MTLPMMTTTAALQGFQRGPQAYHCPFGHGALEVGTNESASTGYCLACPTCGHRLAVNDNLVNAALAHSLAGMSGVVDPQSSVRVFDGSAPRGLLADGTVRTTGWLQVARRPISSGLWATVVGFFLGIGLAGVHPALPLVAAVGGYAIWKLFTMKLVPASKAVNTGRVATRDVVPGELIRMYGTAGPVGQVTALAADAEGRVRLWLDGGREVLRSRDHVLWRVELRN